MRRFISLLIVALTGVALRGASAQVDGTWTGADGNWSDASNWTSSPQFPTNGGVATFNCDGNGATPGLSIIELDTDISLSKLFFGTGPLAFDDESVNGHTMTLTGPAEITVSRNLPGNLAVRYVDDGPGLEGIAGSAGLTKLGDGMLALYHNTYAGDTFVRGGTVRMEDPNAFGTANSTVHLFGTTLEFNWPTLTNNIELAGVNQSINFDNDGTITGQISGTGNVTFSPLGAFSGTLSLSGSNTYTGATHVFFPLPSTTAGCSIDGPNGSIRNSSAVSLGGGSLVLDNVASAQADRIGDSAPLTISAGEFFFKGNSTISLNEQIGTLTTAGGALIGMTQSGSARSQLDFAALQRENRGTLRITNLVSQSSIAFGQVPSLVGGDGSAGVNRAIIPFAVAGDTSQLTFVDYGATGIRPLADAEYFNGLVGAANDYNVNIGTNTTVNSTVTVNALRLNRSAGSVTLSGNGTVSVASGAVILCNANSTISTNLAFGSAEGIVGGAGTISGALSGTNGLTIHDGSIVLQGVSSYTGVTAIRAGTLNVVGDVVTGVPGPLGSDTSAIQLGAMSTLSFSGSSVVTLARDLQTDGEVGPFANITSQLIAPNASTFNISGNLNVAGVLAIGSASNGYINVSGNISGPGAIGVNGSTMIFSGNNSVQTGMIINHGTFLAGSDTAFGSGSIQLGVGAIGAIGGPRTIANDLSAFDTLDFTPGSKMTFTGAFGIGLALIPNFSPGGVEVTVPAGADIIAAGPVEAGAFVLDRDLGANVGTLEFTHANPNLIGPAYLMGGALDASGPQSLGNHAMPITVYSGASLFLRDGVSSNGSASLVGAGVGGAGAICSVSGTNAINGEVTISGPTSIAVDAGLLSLPALYRADDVTSGAMELTKLGGGELSIPQFTSQTLAISAGTVSVTPHVGVANAVRTLSLAGGFSSPTSTLDLNNTGLRIDSASISLANVTDAIRNARDGGAWDLPGITTRAALQETYHFTTLGAMTTADYQSLYGPGATFEGLTTAGSSVLVKFTYYGDTDFNGKVDGSDYATLDLTFGHEATQGDIGGWINGDFNYDGRVDGADYALADLGFNGQSGTLARAIAFLDGSDTNRNTMTGNALGMVMQHFDEFGGMYATNFLAAVPEPANLLALSALCILLKRRRR